MNIIHLTASTFFGGPERQMLGLARAMAPADDTVFLSFAEGGRCRAFLSAVRQHGFEGVALAKDTPRLWGAVAEIADHLRQMSTDILLCHGYKANLLGRLAARRVGIPAIAVSRGWTGESFKVRLYERLDRFHLRFLDSVVCVSAAQAERVRRAGVPEERVRVIRNAIDSGRFNAPDSRYRAKLLRYFRGERTHLIGAAGRLSPEKGFEVLVKAAEQVVRICPKVGFVLYGEGPCRARLQQQIQEAGLAGSFVLAGFRNDLDRFLPHFDLFVLPSYTEGLPNVVLESCAAGVPVVATAVGGTPEVIEDGVSGHLVPAGKPEIMADRIGTLLDSGPALRQLGVCGRERVGRQFGFAAQAEEYRRLFVEFYPDSAPEAGTASDTDAPPAAEKKSDPDLLATGSPCSR
jgi:glycosyltransferase involved in cell wall biosynthesis